MRVICSKAWMAAGLALLASPLSGQTYPPMIIDPSLMKFLPAEAAFTATLDVASRSPAYRWPVRVAFSKGRSRVEMNIAELERREKVEGWEEYVARLKQAGSAESVAIFNPARKCIYTFWPKLQAYIEQPIPENALAELKLRPKEYKSELGNGELEGRPATKAKLMFNAQGRDVWRTWESPEALLWTAREGPAIPLRIDVLDLVGEPKVTLVFSQVNEKKPASELFEPPKGFAKYDERTLLERLKEKWPKEK